MESDGSVGEKSFPNQGNGDLGLLAEPRELGEPDKGTLLLLLLLRGDTELKLRPGAGVSKPGSRANPGLPLVYINKVFWEHNHTYPFV